MGLPSMAEAIALEDNGTSVHAVPLLRHLCIDCYVMIAEYGALFLGRPPLVE
jgi:hypothetical protein